MRVVRGLCSHNWLKMNRASRMSPLTPSLSKACIHGSRRYRYSISLCESETDGDLNMNWLECEVYILFCTIFTKWINPHDVPVILNSFQLFAQFLRQETESLWSEYANQCSQCSQLSGNTGLEQEKVELLDQWRSQQSNLQKRGSSLGAALRQIDSTENHMVDFIDRLDRYLRQPKDITAFTLASTNILKDIKVFCQTWIPFSCV